MLSRVASQASTRALSRRAAPALVPLARTCYTGGLTDKDRIFTNLYNDTSPFLKDALKRVSQQWQTQPARCSPDATGAPQ